MDDDLDREIQACLLDTIMAGSFNTKEKKFAEDLIKFRNDHKRWTKKQSDAAFELVKKVIRERRLTRYLI